MVPFIRVFFLFFTPDDKPAARERMSVSHLCLALTHFMLNPPPPVGIYLNTALETLHSQGKHSHQRVFARGKYS